MDFSLKSFHNRNFRVAAFFFFFFFFFSQERGKEGGKNLFKADRSEKSEDGKD